MSSILQKVNTLISANMHALVDAALESNSVKVMDEYIRQAERNLDAVEDSHRVEKTGIPLRAGRKRRGASRPLREGGAARGRA